MASPSEFKNKVRNFTRSNNGLSRQEFGKLQNMYKGFHPLVKYSMSPWMVGNGYEALDGGLRSNYETYLAAGGAAED